MNGQLSLKIRFYFFNVIKTVESLSASFHGIDYSLHWYTNLHKSAMVNMTSAFVWETFWTLQWQGHVLLLDKTNKQLTVCST